MWAKMELLEYNDDLRWTEDSVRVNYYYNLYKYKFWARIPYIHFFRYTKDEYQFSKRLTDVAPIYYQYRVSRFGDSNKTLYELIKETKSGDYVDLIKNFIIWRREASKQLKYKIKISYNTLEIYSNDSVEFMNSLNIAAISNKRLYYVNKIEDYSEDVIYQKVPKRKYRLYFQLHRFDKETTKSFVKFLFSHDFSLSRSLNSSVYNFLEIKSIKRRNNFYTNYRTDGMTLFTHYYVDFDDDKLLTLLSLFESSIIRRLYRIEKR